MRNNTGMDDRMTFYQCLAGIGTALVVATISGIILWQKPSFWEAMAWQGLILAFLVLLSSSRFEEAYTTASQYILLALVVAIFMVSWRVPVDVYFIYTIIWAAYAPFYLPRKQCWLLLIAINLAWYVIRVNFWNDPDPLIETLLVATFHVFAMLSATAAKESAEANEKTQQLNRELLATQHLLGEASRESERTRIARDLHDLLGHHLTALTINLQVAGRITEGEAKEKIDECHALSKLLLNDVREAVTTLRDMPVVNLRELLEITVRDIPRLQISLEMDDELQLDDVNTAEVMLRLVQEAITNTLKHSNARVVKIHVYRQQDQIVLDYTDNGGGCEQLLPGNGLKGMRERVERLGGELRVESKPTLSLRAVAPMAN